MPMAGGGTMQHIAAPGALNCSTHSHEAVAPATASDPGLRRYGIKAAGHPRTTHVDLALALCYTLPILLTGLSDEIHFPAGCVRE